MKDSLFTLVKQSRTDNHSLVKVIDLFSPKINRSLQQTTEQHREDLSQDLKIKLLVWIRNYDVENTPGFYEMIELIARKQTQYF